MHTSAVPFWIPVTCGTGTGGTALSAFHAALVDVDLANYNLIRLSSVIPPGAVVETGAELYQPVGEWGDRLYCVYAERSATEVGEQAWAGIGWVQRADGKGGLFVEHDGDSEEAVSRAIDLSLRDLVEGSDLEFADPQHLVAGTVCTGEPACALVIAAYQMEGWGSPR